ncbi:hypothetical protein CC2G_015003 [Coprinopsis cinerea AmutBmut pab1-1]|nr:hypothetical protein CC2G_015003 [Coprinopsis cinerea AmutBmut pab1-1]
MQTREHTSLPAFLQSLQVPSAPAVIISTTPLACQLSKDLTHRPRPYIYSRRKKKRCLLVQDAPQYRWTCSGFPSRLVDGQDVGRQTTCNEALAAFPSHVVERVRRGYESTTAYM